MKYAIIGLALAFSFGADARADSPSAPAPSTNGNDAQAAAPQAAADSAAAAAASTTGSETKTADSQAPAANAITVTPSASSNAAQAPGPQAPADSVVAAKPGTTGDASQTPSRFALELHGGTTGVGGQAEFIVNDYLTGRVSGDWLGVDVSANTINLDDVDIKYAGRGNWTTVGVFADVHPFKSGWFLSGGVFQGNRNASFAGVPTQNIVIDGMTFTPDQIGTLHGTAKLPGTSPFAGLGWDQAQHSRRGWAFRFLAGAAFGGPKVTLWDVGPNSGLPIVQQWTLKEEADAQNQVNGYKVYPVVQLGVGYRF